VLNDLVGCNGFEFSGFRCFKGSGGG